MLLPLRKYDNLSIRIFYCNVMDAPLSYSDTELANMTYLMVSSSLCQIMILVYFHSKISCIYSNNAIFNSDLELAQLNKIQGHILR